MYDDIHEFQHRLQGTVVLYNNKPVYIRDIASQWNGKSGQFAIIHPLPSLTDPIAVDFNSSEFNYTNIPLGYCSGQNYSLYLSRIPARKFKQGLYKDNLYIPPIGLGGMEEDFTLPYASGPKVTWDSLHRTKAFFDTLTGNYPSLEKVLDRLNSPNKSKYLAFSRRFAVLKDSLDLLLLMYKGEKIGYLKNGDTGAFSVPKSYSWLCETLEEHNVKVV